MVDLPAQPNGPTILPQQPNEPPSLTDISNSVIYNQQLLISHQAHVPISATSTDIGRGEVYKAQLIQAHAGIVVAPAWFAPALATGLAPLTRAAYVTYNLACGDGRTRHFKVVPFPNGDLPMADPLNLPALTSIAAIRALTGPQATAYLVGYGLPVAQLINDRKKAICVEIGCTVT